MNLFAGLPRALRRERVRTLVSAPGARLELIVARGHRTPSGTWYDQAWREWVVVLRGRARLRFADERRVHRLRAGDWVDIAAHRRHRVEWTDPARPTVWLALHYARRGASRRRR